MKKYILIVFLAFLVMGCGSKTRVEIADRVAPADPLMLTVEVVNGCICGQSKDNIIENYMKLWEAIKVLKAKGFTDKQIVSSIRSIKIDNCKLK